MGKLTGDDISVTINSVDLSDHVRSVTINSEREQVDVSGMGAKNRVYISSLGDGTIEVEFLQDFDASEVDATLWPLSTTTTGFPIVVKPTSATVSTTNPSFSMTGLLFNYSPIAGGIGEALTTTVTFQNNDDDGITRATS